MEHLPPHPEPQKHSATTITRLLYDYHLSPHIHITSKMLYLVGLGLSDETDITVKGLEVVRKAARVYLEAYTSILLVDQSVLVRTGSLIRTRLDLTDI